MDILITKIKKGFKENTMYFSEKFFLSDDNKTIMGEVPFKEILFLEYRDTEAGSNPREYYGIKQTNVNILKSLLKDYKNMFRFLHSGIIVSLINPTIENEKKVKYDYCCLTNGNQTRFIILIITLLKLYFEKKDLSTISPKELNLFLKTHFYDVDKIKDVILFVKANKVNQMITFLLNNKKYLDTFNKMDLNDFLNSRIRIQVNLINSILEDLDDKLDEYSAGTLIAEANNDTQKVKADDIFGNRYKNELETKIFRDFIAEFKNNVRIEYRLGEIAEKGEKVHILTLLRLVVASGILTKEKDIFTLTNQRNPVYKLFENLFKKDKQEKTTKVVSKIIPLLYKIRIHYIEPILEQHRRTLVRKYKKKAIEGDLENSIIHKEINKVLKNDAEIEKLIKRNINYNIEHILPVLIFKIKNLIVEKDGEDKFELNVPEDKLNDFLKILIEVIYETYIELKLKGLPTSLTTVVRSKDFYEIGAESYKTLLRTYNLEETDFVYKNRFLV